MRKTVVSKGCALTLVLGLAAPAAAEEAKIVFEANPTDFPTIRLIANIRDATGEPISGLTAADLEAQEDTFKAKLGAVKEKAKGAVEPIDVVFVFDTTGSMGSQIAAVRDNIIQFAETLTKTNMDYRLGLVTFGDEIRETYEPMADVKKFKEIISKQTAEGGGDDPENALEALETMRKMKFRDKAKVVAILITDAPFHAMDSFTKLSILPVLKAIKEQKIVVYALGPHLEQYLWMAAETGGSWYDVSRNFTELVEQLAASLTAQYVIELETLKKNADATQREVKLLLKNAKYSGSAKAPYRAPSNLEASSVLVEKNRPSDAYALKNMLDGNPKTAWFEGNEGDGIGEWVKMTFSEPKKLTKVGILGGYPKTDKLYKQNNRIKKAMLVLSNGDTQVIDLKDEQKMQYFDVKGDTKTNFLKIVINEVYKGTVYRDTCIAELDVQ